MNKSEREAIVEVEFGGLKVPVIVTFRRRKSLTITVHPDKKVTAKAPVNKSLRDVTTIIKKRSLWIKRHLEYFDQFHPIQPERQYVSGETHYYLGRQYRLKIKQGKPSVVKLKGRYFQMVLVDTSDRKKAKEVLQKWYLEHAKILMLRRIEWHLNDFSKLGTKRPNVRFRRMKRRWGSCSSNGSIVLNTELIKAPIHCIDYVLIHELCHLLYPKHSSGFYRLLSRFIPDWAVRKKRLEKVVF